MINWNSSPPGQNDRSFADDIFRCIFVNEKFCGFFFSNFFCSLFLGVQLTITQHWFIKKACSRIDEKPLSEPMLTHEKKIVTVSSRWANGELTVTTVVTASGPMITAQSRLGEVTAQSRRGHSSVTARSQLSYGEVTAQSRHLQYDHSSVMARSQLNHGPGHGWLWPFWSPWAHGELMVSSHGGQFFSHGDPIHWRIYATLRGVKIHGDLICACCYFIFGQ